MTSGVGPVGGPLFPVGGSDAWDSDAEWFGVKRSVEKVRVLVGMDLLAMV